jgi:hypothetical protein
VIFKQCPFSFFIFCFLYNFTFSLFLFREELILQESEKEYFIPRKQAKSRRNRKGWQGISCHLSSSEIQNSRGLKTDPWDPWPHIFMLHLGPLLAPENCVSSIPWPQSVLGPSDERQGTQQQEPS